MLTDNEIRLKIAELKGWRVYDVNLDYRVEKYMGTSPEGVFYAVLPDWPTDIAAAWELVEESSFYFSLTRTNSTGWAPAPWGEIHWVCRFCAPQKGEVKAETAARAICLAWLKWKGVEVE